MCNIYAPNDDNPDFFVKTYRMIEQFDNEFKIISGDFNLVMDVNLDKRGNPMTHINSLETIKMYNEEADIIDIWRHRNSDSFRYTWKRRNPNPIMCRLDIFFISSSLLGNVVDSDILTSFKSDHSVITLDLIFDSIPRGKGFWKLNTSILKDLDYVQNINNTCLLYTSPSPRDS